MLIYQVPDPLQHLPDPHYHRPVSPLARSLYEYLAKQQQGTHMLQNELVRPGISEGVVRAALQELRDEGYVALLRTRNGEPMGSWLLLVYHPLRDAENPFDAPAPTPRKRPRPNADGE